MKSIFNSSTVEELVNRINSLQETSPAQWGKMNAYQMVKHCRMWQDVLKGEIECKRSFIGKLLGRTVLKAVLKDEKPMGKNSPTSPEIKVLESSGEFNIEKQRWITLLRSADQQFVENFIHPFFGKMTKQEVGLLAYKHIDHHLRQFGV